MKPATEQTPGPLAPVCPFHKISQGSRAETVGWSHVHG